MRATRSKIPRFYGASVQGKKKLNALFKVYVAVCHGMASVPHCIRGGRAAMLREQDAASKRGT